MEQTAERSMSLSRLPVSRSDLRLAHAGIAGCAHSLRNSSLPPAIMLREAEALLKKVIDFLEADRQGLIDYNA